MTSVTSTTPTTTLPTTTVPTTAAGTSSTSTASAQAAATLDYNSFLTLLVTEIQNQDPTSPSDPTQFLGQLASFSAVGQTIQTNAKLDLLQTTAALSQADATIGHTVTSADGTTSGTVSSVAIGTDGALTATLAGGGTLALGTGVKVS